MDSGGVLGRISAVLGKYAEGVGKAWGLRIWEILGGSWAASGHLGRLLEALGLSWALLGCSGALLGAKLEPSWSPKGATSTPRPPNIEAKKVQDGLDMLGHNPNSGLGATQEVWEATLSDVVHVWCSKNFENQ